MRRPSGRGGIECPAQVAGQAGHPYGAAPAVFEHTCDHVSMRTAYQCRAYPDEGQRAALTRTFGCVRVVWNRTLAERHRRWHADHTGMSYAESDRALTAMKEDQDLAAGRAVARGSPGDACGADVRHAGSSRVQSAANQEPRLARAGIPVLQGEE